MSKIFKNILCRTAYFSPIIFLLVILNFSTQIMYRNHLIGISHKFSKEDEYFYQDIAIPEEMDKFITATTMAVMARLENKYTDDSGYRNFI